MNKEELLKTAKPILFNTEMVRAIQNGRETQFRIAIENIREDNLYDDYLKKFIDVHSEYKIGDTLYVRETFGEFSHTRYGGVHKETVYRADKHLERGVQKNNNGNYFYGWKPSIHMPKKYARIFLRVTDVRVERLQDISIDGCYDEGIDPWDVVELLDGTDFKEFTVFKNLWNSTSKDGYKWEDNPYCFVYEFEVIT